MIRVQTKTTLTALWLGLLVSILLPAMAAPIKLSGLFSDHMVIQAGEPVLVYGTATPGEPIGVRVGERKTVAIANEKGEWLATLGSVPAGGPYELSVVGGTEKIVIHDVMAGEVWFCSGQSNMLMSLKQAGMPEQSREPGDISIRFFKTEFNLARKPTRFVNTRWSVLDQSNLQQCSAIPYYFACELSKKLNTPIGIIIAAAPGAPVQSWISTAALAKIPEGRSRLSLFNEHFEAYEKFREQKLRSQPNAEDDLEIWDKEAEAAYQHGQAAVATPPAAALYNGMIAPFVPYTVRGVLWYQGEFNVTKPDSYEKLFTTLMHDWRRKWKKPHLPFLFVQLPPAGPRQEAPTAVSKLARLRDAQAKASLSPWTYMVSAVDTIDAESANWHASNKEVIGRRLAQMALSTQYNKPYPFKGPALDTAVAEGSKVRIRFRNATHGLTARGETLRGFAIAGDDKKLVWAKSEIDGDSVVVWHNLIARPSLVTYSWADNPNGNLYNGDDLPALPFRAQIIHPKVQ